MGKILVFLFDGVTDYEITFVSHLLNSDAGMDVVTVSYDNELIKGKSGLTYKVDKQIKDIDISEVDGLIIGGGWYGEIRVLMYNLITHLNSSKKLLAGICGAGTYVLAKTGVLDNVKFTTPITKWTDKHIECFGDKDPFLRDNYADERVVKDIGFKTVMLGCIKDNVEAYRFWTKKGFKETGIENDMGEYIILSMKKIL